MALAFGGEVAVVTGAGGGLGRAYATELAARGCRVVVNDVGLPYGGDVPVAASVASAIEAAGGVAVADDHDVVTEGAAVVATALEAFGRVDIVVNNAGIGGGGPVTPDAPERWQPIVDITLDGSIAVTAAAWPHLEERGGRVVMTSSPAMFGGSTIVPYSAAKSALYGLTRSFASVGRRAGIGVNAVMPSAWTRLTASLPPGPMAELFEAHYPPEAVASFVVWLCHATCPVSGESFSVGGGRAARVVLAENAGVVLDDGADPAAWGDHLDRLMATDEVVFPRSMNDEVTWQARTLGKPVPEALGPGGALAWDRHAR